MFIHDALDELITCGDTSVETPYLREVINTLNVFNPHTTNTGFEDQFEVGGDYDGRCGLGNNVACCLNLFDTDFLQHFRCFLESEFDF